MRLSRRDRSTVSVVVGADWNGLRSELDVRWEESRDLTMRSASLDRKERL